MENTKREEAPSIKEPELQSIDTDLRLEIDRMEANLNEIKKRLNTVFFWNAGKSNVEDNMKREPSDQISEIRIKIGRFKDLNDRLYDILEHCTIISG